MGRGRGRGSGGGGKGGRGGAWVAYDRQAEYAGGPALPPAPVNLAATAASDSAIDLAWEAGGDGAAAFHVERAPDGATYAEIGTTAGDTTAYADTGLDAETEYTYRVRARNQAGYSAYCAPDSATTEASGPTLLFADPFTGDHFAAGGNHTIFATALPASGIVSAKATITIPDDATLGHVISLETIGDNDLMLWMQKDSGNNYYLNLSARSGGNTYGSADFAVVPGVAAVYELIYDASGAQPAGVLLIDGVEATRVTDVSTDPADPNYIPSELWLYDVGIVTYRDITIADGAQGA